MSIFTSFHFSGQADNEEVLHVIHRHWFNILQNFFMLLVMVLFLFSVFIFLPLFLPALNEGISSRLFMLVGTGFAMMLWVMLFLIWIDYYFDVWIITDKRIVDIEQKGLFSRKVSEVRYDKIQDISTEVHGIIQTFLNYGDVMIQTAAEKEKFAFTQVSDPYRIKDIVMRLQREHMHPHGHDEHPENEKQAIA